MKELVFKKSVFKAVKLVALSSLLMSVGIYLITSGETHKQVIGWVNAILFGFTLLVGIAQLFDRRPQLIANESGLYERLSLTAPIPWSAIEHISLKRVGTFLSKQDFAEVRLTPFSGESLSSTIKRRPIGRQHLTHDALILALPLSQLEGNPKKIITDLEAMHQANQPVSSVDGK